MIKRPNAGGHGARIEQNNNKILLFPPLDPQQDRKALWLDFCKQHRTAEEQAQVDHMVALLKPVARL